jgi:hypothetical protein
VPKNVGEPFMLYNSKFFAASSKASRRHRKLRAQRHQLRFERLEKRVVLAATVLNTSFLDTGTLPANAASMTVTFSEPVLNAGVAANYELRRSGPDGLLGNSDDSIANISSVTMSGNIATLNFAALQEDVYRLTVKNTITDAAGNALDGDGNGTAGGNWRKLAEGFCGRCTHDFVDFAEWIRV